MPDSPISAPCFSIKGFLQAFLDLYSKKVECLEFLDIRSERGILPKLAERLLYCVKDFRFVQLRQLQFSRGCIATANLMDGIITDGSSSRQYSPQCVSLLSPAVTITTSKKRSYSVGCGRNDHSKGSPHFKFSPYFDKGGGKYSTSSTFAKLKKDRPTYTELTVPRNTLKKPLTLLTSASTSSSASQTREVFEKREGELNDSVISDDSEVLPIDSIPNYKYFHLSVVSDMAHQNICQKKVQTLLDTGSLAGNFILRQVHVDLYVDSDIVTESSPITVCGGLDNASFSLTYLIHLRLSYFCSMVNKYESFEIKALILDNSNVQLIIGLMSIRQLNLFQWFP